MLSVYITVSDFLVIRIILMLPLRFHASSGHGLCRYLIRDIAWLYIEFIFNAACIDKRAAHCWILSDAHNETSQVRLSSDAKRPSKMLSHLALSADTSIVCFHRAGIRTLTRCRRAERNFCRFTSHGALQCVDIAQVIIYGIGGHIASRCLMEYREEEITA